MPTIKLLPKKKKKDYSKLDQKASHKERQKIYQNRNWKELRKATLIKYPICQDCLNEAKNNSEYKVELSTEVHHIQSPFEPNISEIEKYRRAFNPDNVIALCSYHHHLRHNTAKNKEDYKLL